MSDILFECANDTCARVPKNKDGSFDLIEVYAAIQGDLWLRLDSKEEVFDGVPLLMVSHSLVDQALKVLMFLEPGQRRTVVVPDHEPVIGVRAVNENKIEISVVTGTHVFAQAECNVMAYLRAVGDFHRTMVHRFLERNPDLQDLSLLWSTDPVVSLLIEHQAQRPRPEILD